MKALLLTLLSLCFFVASLTVEAASIKQTKDSVVTKTDSIENVSCTGNQTDITIPEKPTKEDGLIAWVDYFWAFIGFIILWFVSNQKWLAGINILLIQRFVSKTSSFMLKIRYIATSLSTFLIALLSSGSVTDAYWLNIIENTITICLAIGTLTLFATRNINLISPTKIKK